VNTGTRRTQKNIKEKIVNDHNCAGPIYNFRTCIRCCARFVVSARPSRQIQEGNLFYLERYFNRDRKEVLDAIKGDFCNG
jgi:hypothetical protein